MRILLVGASGTIGKAVATALSTKGHEVLAASRHGAHKVDLQNADSIRALYKQVGKLDAVVSCSGTGAWKPLPELQDADFDFSLANKLMGNVNLVRLGVEHLNDGGSFIVTTGVFGREPIPGVTALAMVNGGLESFVRGAALDLPRGIRINAVCPPFIKETAEKLGMPGGLPATENAKAYVELLEGKQTGQVVVTG
ncbi:MAG: short chain dehydrogenase [Planctomycetes bacterium]|nr:short chain dehydrogenase [Planctomycetota bacterium]